MTHTQSDQREALATLVDRARARNRDGQHAELLAELRALIERARQHVTQAIDAGMVMVYWHVGARVRREVLGQRRAQYGEQIVATLSRQLSWSHFVALLPIREDLRRQFYTELGRIERWPVRTLTAKIQGMLYERTAISRRPALLAKAELDGLRDDDRMTPDLVFRDPYRLDFLGAAQRLQ